MATPFRDRVNKQQRNSPVLPFLLPLPLLITLLFSLAEKNIFLFSVSLTGMGAFLLSGYFIARSNFHQVQLKQRKWQRQSRMPWRFSAALFTAIGTFIIALFAVKQGLLISAAYGSVSFIGMVLYYGLDTKHKDDSLGLSGVSSEELGDAFDEAEARIASIRQAADKVLHNDPQLAARLQHIAKGSESILKIIEDDPNDLRRARKFLKVYLNGAQQVINKYANREQLQNNQTIDSNLRQVLDTIDTVLEEQHQKLLEDDVLELEIQIEVLQTQLKHEGIN